MISKFFYTLSWSIFFDSEMLCKLFVFSSQKDVLRKSKRKGWCSFGVNQNHLIDDRCLIITFEHEIGSVSLSMRLVHSQHSRMLMPPSQKCFCMLFTWIVSCYNALKVEKEVNYLDLFIYFSSQKPSILMRVCKVLISTLLSEVDLSRYTQMYTNSGLIYITKWIFMNGVFPV